MDQAIPLRKISLQNETGLSEDVLNEQAPDAFMIAWRRALPVEQRVGMRGLKAASQCNGIRGSELICRSQRRYVNVTEKEKKGGHHGEYP